MLSRMSRKPFCPKCGAEVVLKEGRYGPFYGCSSYPKCTFTADYDEYGYDGFDVDRWKDNEDYWIGYGEYIASLNGGD